MPLVELDPICIMTLNWMQNAPGGTWSNMHYDSKLDAKYPWWNLIQYAYCESKLDKGIRICSDRFSTEVLSEAATESILYKALFWKFSQYSQENIYVGVSF